MAKAACRARVRMFCRISCLDVKIEATAMSVPRDVAHRRSVVSPVIAYRGVEGRLPAVDGAGRTGMRCAHCLPPPIPAVLPALFRPARCGVRVD